MKRKIGKIADIENSMNGNGISYALGSNMQAYLLTTALAHEPSFPLLKHNVIMFGFWKYFFCRRNPKRVTRTFTSQHGDSNWVEMFCHTKTTDNFCFGFIYNNECCTIEVENITNITLKKWKGKRNKKYLWSQGNTKNLKTTLKKEKFYRKNWK